MERIISEMEVSGVWRTITIIIKRSKTILDRIKKEMELIERVMRGSQPETYQAYLTLITQCETSISYINSWKEQSSVPVVHISELFTALESLHRSLVKTAHIATDPQYSKYMMGVISSSAFTEMKQSRESLLDFTHDHSKKVHVEIADAIKTVIAMLDQSQLLTEEYFIEHSGDKMNEFTMAMLKHLMGHKQTASSARLRLLVNKQKNAILRATRIPNYTTNITRFELVPSESRLLEDTVRHVSSSTSISTLASLSRTMNVVVINRAIGTPLEFNIKPLVDEQYVRSNDLFIKPSQGLSKKVLAKYTTIKLLGDEVKSKDSILSMFVAGSQVEFPNVDQLHVDKGVVLDTIDGRNYRVLSDSNDVLRAVVSGTPTTPQQYNEIQSQIILQNCFKKDLSLVLEKYKTRPEQRHSSEFTMKAVKTHLHKWMQDHLSETEYTNVNQLKGMHIDDEIIVDVLVNTLLVQSPKHGSAIEQTLTYMQKISTIARQFVMQFGDKWNKEPISPRIFINSDNTNNYKNTLHDAILTSFDDVVSKVVIDLDKLGIWLEYDDSLKLFVIREQQIII